MRIWDVPLSPIPAYPGRTDSQAYSLRIRSLVDSPRLRSANHPVALPRKQKLRAIPKYISGRTSYLRVR